jgi:hypothetical protein
LINVAKGMGDEAWHQELLELLKKFSSYQQLKSR